MSSTAATGALDHHHDHTTRTGIPNKKLLMWAFLASDCMFFGSLISTHLIYRLHPPPGNPSPRDVFDIPLTSFSTFILLMSSLMMALAVNAIQKGNLRSLRFALLTTIFFGATFLGCQVFEFTHFVSEKHLTITNSILGTTFYTLTGTHGTHVAIGVLWLILMYVRSFKPADTGAHRGWFLRNLLHVAAVTGLVLSALFTVLAVVHTLETGGTAAAFAGQNFALLTALVVTTGASLILARPRGPVEFSPTHAIDVETMGLYWHFVDIVWIVIFTAVYLLEYL